MWKNNMPRITTPGEQPRRNGQHVTVHITRTKEATSETAADGESTPPRVLKLHVAQASDISDLSACASDEDRSYTWNSPELLGEAVAAQAENEASAIRHHFVLKRPEGWRGIPNEIELQAWDGPTWRERSDFVVLVEFEGGVVLRSDVQTADVAC
jgi:hypothetical protein